MCSSWLFMRIPNFEAPGPRKKFKIQTKESGPVQKVVRQKVDTRVRTEKPFDVCTFPSIWVQQNKTPWAFGHEE